MTQDKKPPERIWLQWYDEDHRPVESYDGDVTWCGDFVHKMDVQYVRYRPAELTTDCSICEQPFTPEEWDERHADEDGNDCHERCCPICNWEDDEDE